MSFKLAASKFLKSQDSSKRDLITFIITDEYNTFKSGIETGNIEAVRLAVTKGVDVNLLIGDTSKGENKHAIEIACSQGDWLILDILLNHPSLKYDFEKLDSLLCIVGKNLTRDTTNETKSSYKKCFKRLIEDSRIDINLTDYRGNSPLHYTVKHKCDELTKLLLNRGAYVGLKNLQNKLPIDGIDCQILKEFFDTRMTSNYDNNNRMCNDFEINLDYSFLIKKPNPKNVFSRNTDQFYPIEFISQSEQLKELITHPLMRYLIWMKSEALALLFIWNIILFIVFFLTLVHITFFNMCLVDENHQVPQRDHISFFYIVTRTATYFCIIVVSVYLLLQTPVVVQNLKKSSYEIWRFLNELCIVLLLFSLFDFWSYNYVASNDLKKQATAICILLISIDMNLLMITIPKFQKISFHFLMLQKISRQFISVLLFYLIILFAFSLAFYVMDDDILKEKDILRNFENLGQTFIRVIGMMIGELNLEFTSLLIVYYIIILVFMFLITIVLINLLNGLAVSDVGEIRLSAKLIYLIYRVQLIAGYEKYFLRHVFMRKFIFNVMRYQNTLSCIKRFKITLDLFVTDVQIYPNKDITIVNNISRPADLYAEKEPREWAKVNKNIVNQLVEHFKQKLEQDDKVTRKDELKMILCEINQKLDRLQLQQMPRHIGTQNVRYNIANENEYV